MEDKKVLYIGLAAVLVLLTGLIGGLFYFFVSKDSSPQIDMNTNVSTNTNANGFLPTSDENSGENQLLDTSEEGLRKEKQFISSYWQATDTSYNPNTANYDLPIPDIKETVTNYRDFSRKINIDSALEKISQNGFAVIGDPFNNKTADWETSYKSIRDNDLPTFITSDSVAGLYQNTMHIIYKEIEEEIFYASLWSLLKDMFDEVEVRYNLKLAQFGIKNDLLTEADRLELAYLTVALELLKPEGGQVKESISIDSKFFSKSESEFYKITVPEYLKDQVDEEIQNIITRKKDARSPIFLYNKNYENYLIPAQYATSEKLKNYYLAITWLNESLFPLWNKSNDCDSCHLDKHDHQINFAAALLLSNDLANNQTLKNQWANIYKSISFFKGLETNLTYLDYQKALNDEFGQETSLEDIINSDQAEQNLDKLQVRLSEYKFPSSLGGDNEQKSETGLRLLRNYHLLENKLLDSLIEPYTGNYSLELSRDQAPPFTTCLEQDRYFRCQATSLDLFNLLGNNTAASILDSSNNDKYNKYDQVLRSFISEMQTYDQNTWHDNAYMAMLSSLQLLDNNQANLPNFMNTSAWNKKTLNTSLGTWTDFHREINFEKTTINNNSGLGAYFPYGYVEPQIEFYGELLSNVNMIIDGFTGLQIMTNISKSFERLDNLKIMLEKLVDISKAELQGEELTSSQYNFINSFNRQIRSFIGDIKKDNIKNTFSFTKKFADKEIRQTITGLNYIIAVYPNTNGEVFFAIGPVFDYNEKNRQNKEVSNWQDEYKIN